MTAHLIACTIAALIAMALMFALRRRSAELRYSILLAAMLAFAVPTPLLTKAANKLLACLVVNTPAPPSFEGFALLPARAVLAAPSRPAWHLTPDFLGLLWAVFFALSLAMWLRRLLRPLRQVREATPEEAGALALAQQSLKLARTVDLCIAAPDRVPGALGWRRPCVVLPDGLSAQLTASELHAILTHELAHIARRDNFSAAVARVIASVFWFHPLVWWIERRMLAEREAACDEMVLAHGADPADYVAAILKVCRMSFEGATGYAGATGANLKQRMEQIMSAHAVRPSSRWLRAIPGAILTLSVAGSYVRAQSPPAPQQAITHPANDAAIRKAFDCWQQGKFEEAEALYRQVYVQDPADSRGIMGLAESYVSEKRPDDAIELLQQEVDRQGERTDLRMALANLFVRIEQYDKAIAEYQRVLDTGRNVNRADLLFRLGEANRRKGDLNEAMRLFREAIEAAPQETNALLQLALLMEGTGKHDQAAVVYEQILKLQPDHPVALNNLAYLKAEQGIDLDAALSMAQKAHERQPDSSAIEDTLAWAYLKNNQSDEAAAAARQALEAEPNNPAFHYHLGLALYQGGERAAAIQELQAALANNPSPGDQKKIQDLLRQVNP